MTAGAGAALGVVVALRWSERPRRLSGLRSALALLETEMAVGRTPLPQAAERVAALASEGKAAEFFGRLAGHLQAGMPAEQAWGEAAAHLAEADPVARLLAPRVEREAEADLEAFIFLGHVIGTSDLADQLKHLGLARERLAGRERQAAEEAARLAPLCRYAGLSAGLLLVLLLI